MRFASRSLALWISTTTAATFPFAASAFSTATAAFTTTSAAAAVSWGRSRHHYSNHHNKKQQTATGIKTPFLAASPFGTSRRNMSSSQDTTSNNDDDSNKVRVALCQFKVCNDKEKNHKVALEYIERASKQGAELVVLPEIWNSPYATPAFPEYAEVLPQVGDAVADHSKEECPSSHLLQSCAQRLGVWIVGGSIPEKMKDNDNKNNEIYNTCLVMDPHGTIVAKHSKVHLFDIDVPGKITFFESDTLSAGNQLTSFTTPKWGTIGIGICYDIRFPEYAMLLCQNAAAKDNGSKPLNMLIYPGAFNLTTGPAHWELLQRARALDNQCFVLTASPARTTEDELPADENDDNDANNSNNKKKYPHYTAWGHSTVVSPWGDVIATTDESESLVVVDLDLSKVDEIRSSIPIIQQKRHDLYTLEKS